MTCQSQNSNKLMSLVLLILAVVFTGLTTAELILITGDNNQGSQITADMLDQLKPDQETTQLYLAQYRQAAEQLARNNSFVPTAQAEPPKDCTAILGDEACFGDRWVKAGDTLGEAKVLEIGPTAVTLQWGGKRITRSPVLVAANTEKSSSRNRSSNSNKQQNNRVASANSPARLLEDVEAGKLSREDALKKVYDAVTNDVKSGKIPQEAADEIVGEARRELFSVRQ